MNFKKRLIDFLLTELERGLNWVVWLDAHIGTATMGVSSTPNPLPESPQPKLKETPSESAKLPLMTLQGAPMSSVFEGFPELAQFPTLKNLLVSGKLVGAAGEPGKAVTLSFRQDTPPDKALAEKLYLEGSRIPNLIVSTWGDQLTLLFPRGAKPIVDK